MVMWEGVEGATGAQGNKGSMYFLRLDRASSTLTWVKPSWSALKSGNLSENDPFTTDFNLSFNPEETLAAGLLTKLASQAAQEQTTNVGSTLDEG